MQSDTTPDHDEQAEAVIDQEAAQIDPRSPEAAEEIAELMEDADQMGLERSLPDPLDPPEPA